MGEPWTTAPKNIAYINASDIANRHAGLSSTRRRLVKPRKLMSKITLLKKVDIASILMFIVFELCQYPLRMAQCKGSSAYKTEVLLRIHHPRIAKAMAKTNV
jgi:hypothetical protein